MIATHHLHICAECPADGSTDIYEMTVEVPFMLPVEDILLAVKEEVPGPIYQEELTERISLRLNAKVTTTGVHSGVTTTVVAV